MIPEWAEKIKAWCAANKSDLFTAAVIFLTGLGSFGLGRLSAIWPEKTPVMITGSGIDTGRPAADVGSAFGSEGQATLPQSRATIGSGSAMSATGKYVASKSGSSYHFPWCPGAVKIKASNKIWFATKEEAVAKGYKPAANCPGL